MRTAVTGDLHLNNNTYNIKDRDSRLPIKTVDSFKAFDFFIDECIARKVDRIVLAGDIWNNHYSPCESYVPWVIQLHTRRF